MTPASIAEKGTEGHHQQALFAYVSVARRYGWAAADDERSYTVLGHLQRTYGINPREQATPNGKGRTWIDDGSNTAIDELEWLHAIPNGERRDGFTAALLKGQGVKPGICDVFLPLPMIGEDNRPGVRSLYYAGLYIEMKRPANVGKSAGKTSAEQDQFIAYARRVGYAVAVCFNWIDAVKQLRSYIEECRKVY